MSRLLRLVSGSEHEQRPGVEAGWLAWLMAHVDPGWRPREWDQDYWLFTGDLGSHRTAAWPCRTPSCPGVARRYGGRCSTCYRARTANGLSEEEFDRGPKRARFYPLVLSACSVQGCEREVHSLGLCLAHYRAWGRGGAGDKSLEDFVASAQPLGRLGPCLVPGCPRQRHGERGLCKFHRNRLRRQHGVSSLGEADVASWAKGQSPRLGAHQFSLAGLAETVRFELLYALQCRDTTPPPLAPLQVRILIGRLAGASSVREVNPEAVCENGGQQYNSAVTALFRDLRRHLERAWAHCTGADPYEGDVWEVALLDLQTNASRRWLPATEGVIDFRPVGLRWLREVLEHWARTTRPYLQRLREALQACRTASETLVAAGRTNPASLGAGDFTRVVDAISGQRRTDGTLYSASHRNLILFMFCEVVEHGRACGLMAEVPDPFRPTKRRYHTVEEANEDELGKALPETVIAQLDQHLDLLGPTGQCGPVSAADLQAMHQTIYQVLRDTGRRPGEVVSLKVGCIEVIDGQHNLVYDNHKAARRRRRLPITTATAELVLAWERRRAELPTSPATSQWLFPSPLLRSRQSLGHVTASCVGREFREWVRQIPKIDGELLGPDGAPLPFDRSLITPSSLRHCYAQRHADAGVPVDVLKELMDHVVIQTTLGYYKNPWELQQMQEKSLVAWPPL